MAPPRASISRTICPLATPPMAGLQLIWATVSRLVVSSATLGTHPRGRQRRLGPRVPGPDHHHIVLVAYDSCRTRTVQTHAETQQS